MYKNIKIAVTGMLAAIFVFSSPVSAEPLVSTIINYYDITGTSGRELKRQMKRLGPNGYWAYTRWNVRWSSNCVLKVKVTYTYPRLKNPDHVPPAVQINWQLMMEKLVLHEQGHGQHGITAAEEIEAANCKGAKRIVRKWAAQDRIYDEETGHGRTQGIHLSD